MLLEWLISAAFAAAYAATPGRLASRPEIDEILITEPPPVCAIQGVTVQVARTAAMMSTSKLACQPASSSVTPKPDGLLTRTSTRPSAPCAASRKDFSASALPTSQLAANTLTPSPAMACRTSSSASAPRAQIATFAPSRAKPSAMARPMPLLAPVTMTPLPFSPRSMSLPFYLYLLSVYIAVNGGGREPTASGIVVARNLQHRALDPDDLHVRARRQVLPADSP